jgi:hypothetical protein
MVEMDGHGVDAAGDKTRIHGNIVGRRWFNGKVEATVWVSHGRLDVRFWPGPCFLIEDADGEVIHGPDPVITELLLTKLRTMMILDELADV